MNELEEVENIFRGMQGEELIKKLFIIEGALSQLPQSDIPTDHVFANGVYARTIRIPKGSFIIGRMHRFDQINTVSQGDISVLTDNGMVRMTAPHTFFSSAGTKRAAYTHEETVWTTYCRTESKDPDEAERELTVMSYEQFLLEKNNLLKIEGE